MVMNQTSSFHETMQASASHRREIIDASELEHHYKF
jgi:hypothetical protein